MVSIKIKGKYFVVIAMFVAAIVIGFYLTNITGFFVKPTTTSGQYDDFAKCLTDKGIVMAGTDWCHYCKSQKEMFGTSFQYINYKNCDNDSWCRNNGVTGYPTWVFPDGTKYPGVQSLEKLAELSGCALS